MFFISSKIAGFFILPSNALAMLGLLGLVLLALTPFPRIGVCLIVLSTVLLLVIGYSPLGNIMMGALEDRFPKWDASRGAPDGIVVLGGAIGPEMSLLHDEPALDEAAERITAIGSLARRYPHARIVYSGGNGALVAPQGTEAEYALRLFLSIGISRERITLEDRSRTTAENAAFTKVLVQPKPGERWILVTSAMHMPRAIGSFRHAGFPVEAYPVDWRTGGRLHPFASAARGLARTDAATHEWAGLLGYWLTGRTERVFPAP